MEHDNIKVRPPSPPPFVDYREILRQSQHFAQSGQTSKAFEILVSAEKSILADTKISPYERDLNLSRIYINRGIIHKNMRSLEESAKCYEKAMEILEKAGDGAKRERFSAIMNLAILRTRFRDKARALTGFIRAEEIVKEFDEPERNVLLSKVLMNRAQMHLEFQEIEEARELLDRIESMDDKRGKKDNREKKARVSAHLGRLVAHIAEMRESGKHANEHLSQALKFFNEARASYDELGLTRDVISQRINIAEALISLKRTDEAKYELEDIYSKPELESETMLKASTAAKLLIISSLKSDEQMKTKWLSAVQDASRDLRGEARSDFLEGLESRLRWIGSERLIEDVQELRGREG